MRKTRQLLSVLLILSMILTMPGVVLAEDAVLTASSEQDAGEVKIADTFREQFDKGLSDWEAVQGKGFTTSKTDGLVFSNMKEYLTPSYLVGGNNAWKNYAVSAKITPKNGNYAGILLRYRNFDNHYLLQFYFSSGKVALLKKVNGGMYNVVREVPYKFKFGTEFSVVASAEGNHFVISIDDSTLFEVNDDSIQLGKIGIRGFHSIFNVSEIAVECFEVGSAQDVATSKTLVNLGLPEEYGSIPAGLSTKERFYLLKSELPDEMPVVKPMEPKGKYEIFVSPDGNDNVGDGSIEKPYKTIQKALNATKLLPLKNGVVIWMREGIYEFIDTLSIANLNGDPTNPIFISAYQDEDVKFIASHKLDNSMFEPVTNESMLARLDDNIEDKIRVIDLRKAGITSIPEMKGTKMGSALFMDGTTFNLARYPNLGYAHVEKVIDKGPITIYNQEPDDGRGFTVGMVTDTEPLTWKDVDDIWVRGGFAYEWYQTYTPIDIDYEARTWNSCGTSSVWGVVVNADFWYYNVFEELNFPGEYYIDRETMKLYLYPVGEITEDSNIFLSTSSTALMELQGCSNVVFSGISFEAGTTNAVNITSCNDIVIQSSLFQNFASNTITMTDATRCGATTCKIIRFGDRAFYDGTGSRWITMDPRANFIQNCAINGNKDQILHSMISMTGKGDIASHNLLTNGYATGVGTGGWEMITEYNEIVASPKYQLDSGGTYGGAPTGMVGQHTRYNYIHDILPTSTNSITRGIYLDVMGSFAMVYGNIMYKIPAGIFFHGGQGNSAVNNVTISLNASKNFAVANSRNMLGAAPANDKKSMTPNNVVNPIVEYRYPYFADWLRVSAIADTEYYQAQTNDETPQKTDAWVRTYLPGHMYYANNVSALGGGKFVYEQSPEAPLTPTEGLPHDTTEGLETNYTCEGDPFVDSANQNFNIKPDSEIYKAIPDFEAPPFDKMGLIIGDGYMERPYMGEFGDIFAFSPADGDQGTYGREGIEFLWTDVIWSNRYRLEVATDPDFNNVVYDEVLEYEYATLDLPDFDTTYYWRVTATTLCKDVDPTPLKSQVFSFKTATEKQVRDRERIPTGELDSYIEDLEVQLSYIVEGTTGGTYVAGTRAEAQKMIAEAKKISRNPENKEVVFEARDKIKHFLFTLKSRENYGYTDLTFEKEKWVGPATDQFLMEYDELTGVLTLKSTLGITDVEAVQPTCWKQIYRFQLMLEKFNAWFGITTHWDPMIRQRYFFVLNQNVLEYQLARNSTSSIVRNAVNDGIVVPGKWCEVEMGAVAVEEGVWFYLKLDDKEIFNHIDTNAAYTDGVFQIKVNPENGKLFLKKTDKGEATPPPIPTLESLGQTDRMEY